MVRAQGWEASLVWGGYTTRAEKLGFRGCDFELRTARAAASSTTWSRAAARPRRAHLSLNAHIISFFSSSVYLLETFIFLDRNPLERDRIRVV